MDASRRRIALIIAAGIVVVVGLWLLRQPGPASPPAPPVAPPESRPSLPGRPSPQAVAPQAPLAQVPSPQAPRPAEQASPPAAAASKLFATVEAEDDWGDAPLTVNFKGIPSGGGATPPYTFTWHFGDGSPPSAEQNPTHVYKTPGTYRATLIIRDAAGKVAFDNTEISVDPDPDQPTPAPSERFFATVEVDEDWGDAPMTSHFTAIPSGPGGAEPYAYTWDFGDGSPPSTEKNPTHVYATPGEYVATVVIRAANGKEASDFAEISVEAPE